MWLLFFVRGCGKAQQIRIYDAATLFLALRLLALLLATQGLFDLVLFLDGARKGRELIAAHEEVSCAMRTRHELSSTYAETTGALLLAASWFGL